MSDSAGIGGRLAPLSAAERDAIDALGTRGGANGYATLDAGAHVPVTQLPAATALAAGTQSAAHFSAVEALGTMSTQNANAVAIEGGTIDDVIVGGITPAQQADMAAAYAAGWRSPVVVHDDAFNGTSVVVSGLQASKRYRCTLVVVGNGEVTYITCDPNASTNNCKSLSVSQALGVSSNAYLLACIIEAAGTVGVYEIVFEPRRGGYSIFRCDGLGDTAVSTLIVRGYTSTDFTSLRFSVGLTAARTGWLTVVEETP
jgi:hypothetical protein